MSLHEAVRQLAAEKAAAVDGEYGCCHSVRDFLIGISTPNYCWELEDLSDGEYYTDMIEGCLEYRDYVRDCAKFGVAP